MTSKRQRRDRAISLSDSEGVEIPRIQILVLADEHASTHTVASGQDLVIGRDPTSDIVITDPSVELAHARLRVGDPCVLEDLGGPVGTYVGSRCLRAGEAVQVPFNEIVRIGNASLVIQRRSSAPSVCRVRSHDYFEGRLGEECARARRHAGTFVLLRVFGHPIANDRAVSDTIARMIRATDVLCSYAPGDFEVLLADASSEGARAIGDAMVARCAVQAIRARVTVTSFPHDGTDPDQLLAAMREEPADPDVEPPIVLRDGPMKQVYDFAARVAKGAISVLLLGETGVGKEVLAEAIHEYSPRSRKPLLRLSCVALSESLLESELFGHEKGAFTGAHQAKPGLIESADGGTVFLDEVAEMPPSTQAKLLRVIEQRMLTRVGGLTSRPVDIRFIAATNRDLEVEIQRGTFRKDLYYRLAGITIVIPPLRERRSEIVPLATMFVAHACTDAGRTPLALSQATVALFHGYAWPGNIRELRNVIARAVLLCLGDTIELEHVPFEKMRDAAMVVDSDGAPAPETVVPLRKWSRTPDPTERDRIRELLERYGGNQHMVAHALGISRRTLMNRMDRYELPRPRKR